MEAHGRSGGQEDRRSDGRAAAVVKQLLHDGGVGQGGDVAQVALVAGDLTEHPPHYLPWGRREGKVRCTFTLPIPIYILYVILLFVNTTQIY